ncbi:MAG: hypothetical protein E6K02_09765 [Methanobacteriota archaeon]|nr:MAG: hypothetical protein E6K02_09765 [Euryarchaeota archaeon]
MAPERYLFRADSEGYAYRRILEVRPGSVRLLQPSENARRFTRWISTLFALGFVFVFGAFVSQTAIVLTLSGLSGLVIEAALIAFYFAGLILLLLWWDDRSLPLLAENPGASMGLDVRGITSFGTFQEIRARTNGREVRIAVHGSKEKVGEALRFAGFAMSPT